MIGSFLKRIPAFLQRFFFAPASPLPLETLRIGVAATLLLQLFFTADVIFDLYGENAYLQTVIQAYFAAPIIEITSITEYFATWGVSDTSVITAILFLYGFSLFFLLIGLFTNLFSKLAWFLHLVLFQGHMSSYGVDSFANIFLFYLMLAPLGRALALFPTSKEPLIPARLVLRAAQIHLAVSYFASGLEKASGPQWWNGDAIWRSMMLPIYAQFDLSWLANVPWLAVVLGWGTLLIETAYPFFIAWPKTRRLWVALALSLHLGIALFLGLHVFGFFMCVLSLSLFGVSAEPRTEGEKRRFSFRDLTRLGPTAVKT